jgi:hypothetical protein
MKGFSEWDFTLPKYVQLCKTIIESEYRVLTVRDFLAAGESLDGCTLVILRHDVDRKPINALRMAEVEARLGLQATYYFRAKPHTFKKQIIHTIHELGHEVGYHYEDLSEQHGNFESAIEDFEANLDRFRELVPIDTICMHGRPLSQWDNRELWKKYNYQDFNLIGEPYLSIDYSDVVYLSDTGRSWDSDRFSIRDTVSAEQRTEIKTTAELIAVLRARTLKRLLVQCHPERWSQNIVQWLHSFSWDWASNVGKVLLAGTRRNAVSATQ